MQLDEMVAATGGLDPALLKKMLPLLAMWRVAPLSRQGGAVAAGTAGTGGGLGGAPGSVFDGGPASGGGLPGGLCRHARCQRRRKALDDILRMAGKR